MEDCLLTEFENESLDYAILFTEKQKITDISIGLAKIILLYRKIIGVGDEKKRLLSKSKQLVLETIHKLKDVFTVKQLCDWLSISTHQYYSWKNNMDFKASLLKLCRKKFPSQLTDENVKAIKTYMDNVEFQFLSRATVYWKMIRDGTAIFSKSVFYKYCKLLGYHKRPFICKSKRNTEGIKATTTAEILHTDITYITTADDKTSYLSFVEDNFSKYILSGKASKTPVSAFIKDNIADVVKKYNLNKETITLITDNGSENKGELDTWIQTEMRTIKKVIAR